MLGPAATGAGRSTSMARARLRMSRMFGADALTGTDGSAGDAGFGQAITMGRNQGVVWATPETYGGEAGTLVGGMVRSTVVSSVNAGRMEFTDGGIA